MPVVVIAALISNTLSFSFAEIQLLGPGELPDPDWPDRTVPDPKDSDHEDKMPKNTRAGSVAGKTSSRYSIQDWSDDDFDGDCRKFINPTPLAYAIPASPLAYAFPAEPSTGVPDEDVVDVALLNQEPPPSSRVGMEHGVRPQSEPVDKSKRQKVGIPLPNKQRPVASG
jgi:hypothetical protein